MAAGCAPRRGQQRINYAVAKLGWRADLGPHGGLSNVGHIKL